MGELVTRTHVASGENASIGGSQAVIHLHASTWVVRHAGCLQPQPFDIRRPAHRHQDFVYDRFPHFACRIGVVQHLLLTVLFYRLELCRQGQSHPVLQHSVLDNLGGIGVFFIQQMGAAV